MHSLLYSFSIIGNGGFGIEFFVSLIVGLVVIVLFFRRQLSMEHPMLRVRVLANKTFLMGTIIGMVVQAALLSVGILLPIYLQSLLGYSATESGLVLLPGALIMGVMGPIAGRWFDRHGPRVLAVTGTLMLTIGTVMLAFLGPEVSLVYVAVVMAIRLFGMALINMTITTWAMNALPNDLINHGTSVNNMNLMAQSVNTTVLDGIFCAGGDAKFDMQGNIGAMWCFSVPLGFLAAFWLKLPVMVVYCIVNLDEIVKLPAVYLHYKKYVWVRNITRDIEE